MDKTDRNLLAVLDSNPTITTKQLGKKLRVSQQVADYRIKKLIERKVITKFGTIIDLYRLNIQQYRLFLRFNSITKPKRKKIFTYLQKHPNVYWAARTGGAFDLLIVVGVPDYPALDTFLDELYKNLENSFKGHDAHYVLKHSLFRHKYLKGKRTTPPNVWYWSRYY